MSALFRKVLIANRGEIALRILRACRELGIATVAVHSTADATAMHVRLADESVCIGPPPASESYLNALSILAAAEITGADAIHPGYGFLAENADFAQMVIEHGFTFIGPSPEHLRIMGDKILAKKTAAELGLPVVPGTEEAIGSDAEALAAAERIGFPLLIKAAAGGGGRGMTVVQNRSQLEEALRLARREAKLGFGDDRVYLERYLDRPRHIEIQVLGDLHGNLVHLGERDCTLQRRHQKVLEEAPAAGPDETLRRALGAAAVRLAAAAGYEGAGTVEFLLAPDGAFYFIEANTRLQVEHPVTEAITGLDLVEWQIRIAEGRPLPLAQDAVRARGHAVEARLYAEDPAKGFLPSTGRLERLLLPEGLPGVRVDTGVRQGDAVTPFYDPLIAKIVVHGEDRMAALARLEAALDATAVLGPATNLAFLRRVVREPAFRAAAIDTVWLDREGGRLAAAEDEPEPIDLVAGALLLAAADRERAAGAAGPWRTSPWIALEGFRLGAPARRELRLLAAGREHAVRLEGPAEAPEASLDGTPLGRVRLDRDGPEVGLELTGHRITLRATLAGDRVLLARDGRSLLLRRAPAARAGEEEVGSEGLVAAPMPGKVVRLAVAPGDVVERGRLLAVLEAMKMEHRLEAPRDGRVVAVHVAVGEQVEEGTILLDLADPEAAG